MVVKAGLGGLLGAAALAQPEDAEAGVKNLSLAAVRAATDQNVRTLDDERSSVRGERNVSQRATLSTQEKDAIRQSIKGRPVDEVAAFAAARDWKKRHPKSEWEVPSITGVQVADNGGIKIKTANMQYQFNKDPATNRPAKVGSPYYQKIVNNIVDEMTAIAARAKAGDPAATRIMDNAGWYKNTERRLRTEYGSFSNMMADILGATSPNTPVATNFNFSQDILARATRGEFDDLMNGFADKLDRRYALQDEAAAYVKRQMEKGRRRKDAEQDERYVNLQREQQQISNELQAAENTIKQDAIDPKTGQPKNYGINSYNSMIALADRWRVLRPGAAPKAKNFSGNLSGRSEQATIDVWAARNLRRHSGRKPIPSAAESGVTGNIVDAENFTNSLEFGFGQDVIADATVRINNELGMDLDPRDLQALMWFAEKDVWAKNGWTSVQGEGGSFETMMDQDPVQSAFLGLSREQNQAYQGRDFVPTPEQNAETARKIARAGLLDEDVRAVKGQPTIGQYDDPETAMDIDIVSRRDQMPVDIFDAAARQAVLDNQDSWFIATRIDDALGAENADLFNVGSEVYFRDAVKPDDPVLADIQRELKEGDVFGYTMIIDPRDPNSVTGVRFLDVPQFSDPDRFANMSQPEYSAHVSKTLGDYNVIGQRLKSRFPQVQSAIPGFYDVNVKSRGQTQSFVTQLENPSTDIDGLYQEFYGFKPARQRFQEWSRQDQSPDISAGDGVARTETPSGPVKGFATPRALTGTALASTAATAAAPTALDYGLGILDAAANTGSALAAGPLNAALNLGHLALPIPTDYIKQRSDDRLRALDYQPRTQIGRDIDQQFKQGAASLLGPTMQTVGDAYDRSLTKQGVDLLGQYAPRTQMIMQNLLDVIP